VNEIDARKALVCQDFEPDLRAFDGICGLGGGTNLGPPASRETALIGRTAREPVALCGRRSVVVAPANHDLNLYFRNYAIHEQGKVNEY